MSITNIDLSYLEEITGNDREMILEMLALFISDIPTQVNKIRTHVDKKELAEIAREAHKIKATLKYIGLSQMSDIMQKLETFGREGIFDAEIPSLIQKLEEDTAVVIPLLEKKQKELS